MECSESQCQGEILKENEPDKEIISRVLDGLDKKDEMQRQRVLSPIQNTESLEKFLMTK